MGAIILFVGVVPALSFYIGTQYTEIRQVFGDRSQSTVSVDTTSNKTIISEKYGFSFSYPSDWDIVFQDDGWWTPPAILADINLQSQDKKHIVRFFPTDVNNLGYSFYCHFYLYDSNANHWKKQEPEEESDYYSHCSEAVAARDPEILMANATVGNNILALSTTEQNPFTFLIPMQGEYGLMIQVIDRSPTQVPGFIIASTSQAILDSVRLLQ